MLMKEVLNLVDTNELLNGKDFSKMSEHEQDKVARNILKQLQSFQKNKDT